VAVDQQHSKPNLNIVVKTAIQFLFKINNCKICVEKLIFIFISLFSGFRDFNFSILISQPVLEFLELYEHMNFKNFINKLKFTIIYKLL